MQHAIVGVRLTEAREDEGRRVTDRRRRVLAMQRAGCEAGSRDVQPGADVDHRCHELVHGDGGWHAGSGHAGPALILRGGGHGRVPTRVAERTEVLPAGEVCLGGAGRRVVRGARVGAGLHDVPDTGHGQ